MVSVIIPNYNHSKYLPERIDSVLNQTYQDFELIILDDCSPDESRNVIDQYRGYPKISHIVYNEQNSGSTFKQWKKGIELARGEWIWIAESDDWCEPTFLQTLIDGITSECVLAFAQSMFVAQDGRVIWNSRADYFEQVTEGNSFVQQHMLLTCGIANASMCIFKKQCFYQVDEEYTTFKVSGDWLFWVYIANQGNMFISGKVLNYFRQHLNTVSGPAFKNGVAYLDFFKILDNFQRNAIITAGQKTDLLLTKFALFLKDKKIDTQARESIYNEFKARLHSKTIKSEIRYRLLGLGSKVKKALQKIWPM